MRRSVQVIIVGITTMLLAACEEEYIPVSSGDSPEYVVEGYLEVGDNPAPPYLILTRTFDFYGAFGPDEFNDSFVHDADVLVSDGSLEISLQEICFFDLDSAVREQLAEQFGFRSDTLSINFCVYVDLLNQLQPQTGKSYDLLIAVDGDTITSTTRIPKPVPLDSLMFQPPPGDPNDSLAQLTCYISDPAGVKDFYRYFVGTNGGQLKTGFSSVEEDLFFDGKSFGFQLFNPETESGDVEPEEFGLYFVGDTVTVKWCTIDEPNFDFWNTLEFAKSNQGPFSSYTRIQSNITGGLGVWGGYSVSYYTLEVAY
ncbi:MAG: DUF4249 family protein [Saprospiraceae bacterium]|nr:DUF4249 family protein [Saprospiraceae bacterium]